MSPLLITFHRKVMMSWMIRGTYSQTQIYTLCKKMIGRSIFRNVISSNMTKFEHKSLKALTSYEEFLCTQTPCKKI